MKHVFISYRSSESAFANHLADSLEAHGIAIWMDQRSRIIVGDDWRVTIQSAIDTSSAIIAIMSPSYLNSRYCRREMMRADSLNIPVFPVLYQAVQKKDWPIWLQETQYLDMTNSLASEWDTKVEQLATYLKPLQNSFPKTEQSISQYHQKQIPPIKLAEDRMDTVNHKLMLSGSDTSTRASVALRRRKLQEELKILELDYEAVMEVFFTTIDPEYKNAFERKMEKILKNIDKIESDLAVFNDP